MKRALLLVLLLSACAPGGGTPTPVALVPTPGFARVINSLAGTASSDPLRLTPGRYTLTYTLQDPGGATGCTETMGLWIVPDVPPTPAARLLLRDLPVEAGATWVATTTLDVAAPAAGVYRVIANGDCLWQLLFTYP